MTSSKIIDWDIYHKILMEDLFFCVCLKEQMQSLLQHFGSFTQEQQQQKAASV